MQKFYFNFCFGLWSPEKSYLRGNLVHGQTLAPQQDLNYLSFKVDNVAAKNAQLDLGFSSNTEPCGIDLSSSLRPYYEYLW
jgi:hypothetical protein